MTKDLDSGAACGARPATAGCLRASAGQGCGPHGSKEPQRRIDFFCRGPCSASSAAFIRATAYNACCGLPHRDDGRLGERRRKRRLSFVVAYVVDGCQSRFPGIRRGLHEPAEFRHSCRRTLRALRPSIYTEGAGGRSRRCGEKRRDTPGPARSSLRRGRKRFGNSDYTFYLCA